MEVSVFLRQALLWLHLVGLAFGLGSATVADYMFYKSLKMGDRITAETVERMRAISNVVWVGIGLLGVSGIGMFAFKPEVYMSSAGFLAKMMFVVILVINGVFLNFYATARLTTFNFSQIYTRRDAAWKVRKLSFVFGATSVVSWYATLAIAMFKDIVVMPFWFYAGAYFVVLGFAILSALKLEKLLYARYRHQPQTLDRLTAAPSPAPMTVAEPIPTTPVAPAPQPVPLNQVPVPVAPVPATVPVVQPPTHQPVQPQADSSQI